MTGPRSTRALAGAAALGLATLCLAVGHTPAHAAGTTLPPESTFFSTASVGESSTIQSASDGDLWASCWADDGNLYAANGDGRGFSTSGSASDVAVSRIAGTPGSLTGTTVALGNAVSQIWTAGNYNRKPTGMACVNNTLYLAVQDLNTNFDDAPTATIVKSVDHGATWTWDHTAPMFGSHIFTTMFFADFGQNSANAPDGYVYVYGLDNNWRTSFSGSVPNPVDLYLARVPSTSVQTRSAWQFFSGTVNNSPTWSSDINARQSVLHDARTMYPTLINSDTHKNVTPLAQGGVLYDKPLNRYIYSSWTDYTYEFYESPTPYGPWSHFLTKDFGAGPWTSTKNGGYATTIPSKFLSSDGLSGYLQSNVCPCGTAGLGVYNYALRPVHLTVGPTAAASNAVGATNLAQTAGTVPIERVAHFGNNGLYNDGNLGNSEDDWNNELKGADSSWWGYTWPRQYNVGQVVYTTGKMYSDGGWFASNLRVQVRHANTWVDVAGTTSSPTYPYNTSAGTNVSYTFTFDPVSADGVRVIGTPGGSSTFTSVGEVTASYPTQYNVRGAILVKYNSSGAASGPEGAATSNELGTPDGIGRFNTFQNGSIYWTPSTGAEMVYGLIFQKWASLGYERGVLGYPTTDEVADPQGRRSTFQNGYIIFNSSTGVTTAYHTDGTQI